MTVRVEKHGAVWKIIRDRPEARNAMDPKSADSLTAAFLEFDADKDASVAVAYGRGAPFARAGISNTSVRSMLIIRWARSISLLLDRAARRAARLRHPFQRSLPATGASVGKGAVRC